MASVILRRRLLPLQHTFVSNLSKKNASSVKRIPSLSQYNVYNFSTAASEETEKNIKEGVGVGVATHHHQTNKKILKISDVPISEVLKAKHTIRWVEPVISQSATISEAIVVCIERGLSGMMVVDREEHSSPSSREKGKVVGLVSSRDLLRIIAAGIRKDKSAEEILAENVSEFMTPISQVIYARPDETIRQCRTIMAKLGVKCLPILSHGRVEGLITQKDMSDFGLDARDRGGKKNFLHDVSSRVGLSSDLTSMAEPPTYVYREQMTGSEAHVTPLICSIGLYELPHPFKTPEKCGITKRDYGPLEFGVDTDLSEDAHFYLNACSHTAYFGVADGVGSWREYGIDPREFSHALMHESKNVIQEILQTDTHENSEDIIHKVSSVEVLAQAYQRVKDSNIIGSSTACVAVFDGKRHQLHFSNLGDSGVIVLRHIDSSVAGALKRNRTQPRLERTSDLRIAFVSQQQLRSFNHPYQLGFTGINSSNTSEESTSFKCPLDSCTSSIHVRKGDVILLATDGLFDNVDMDDIVSVVLAWETKQKQNKSLNNNSNSNSNIQELAKDLAWLARERSLDDTVDSPFAILAKENDIMWSGGMPDDCTVIAMHVVEES